jgi:hypothetical protein
MLTDSSSPLAKRVKFNSGEASPSPSGGTNDTEPINPPQPSKPITIRANSHIHLCYHDPLLPVPFHTFPTYTHQLFDNERIGQRIVMIDDKEFVEEEKVFLNEEEAKHFKIEVHIDTRTWKQAVNITGLSTSVEEEARRQLIQARLAKGVAEDATFHHDHHVHFPSTLIHNEEESELQSPQGTLLRTFTVKDNNTDEEGEKYETYICASNNMKTATILARAEKIAMWFIETADTVDFYNNSQWELVTLYQCGIDKKDGKTVVRSLVGYITLFTFHTPMMGSRLRICQALISPYKQSKGLGRELMQDIYQLAQVRENIIEVTVEDPCPGFERLRDIVDYEWAVQQCANKKWWEEKDIDLASHLKIIKSQAIFIQEAYEYLELIQTLSTHYKKEDVEEIQEEKKESSQEVHHTIHQMTDLEKLAFLHEKVEDHVNFPQFRLKVKRHLVKEYKDLKYLDSANMKKELSKLFNKERMNRFHHILRAAYRLGLVDNQRILSSDFLAVLC